MKFKMRFAWMFSLTVLALAAGSCTTTPDSEAGPRQPPTHPLTDFDGDGTVDWKDSDDDNDQIPDAKEIENGTDPRDPSSR